MRRAGVFGKPERFERGMIVHQLDACLQFKPGQAHVAGAGLCMIDQVSGKAKTLVRR